MQVFYTVKPVTLQTIEELGTFLEKFVESVFPDNAVEYWFPQRLFASRCEADLTDLRSPDVAYVAAFPRLGNEGQVIEVVATFKGGITKNLARAKIFASRLVVRDICAAITEALEHLVFYSKQPIIHQIDALLPQKHRQACVPGVILVQVGHASLKVCGEDGTVFDYQDFSAFGDQAKFHMSAYLMDWLLVLRNRKAKYKLETSEPLLDSEQRDDPVATYVRLNMASCLRAINQPDDPSLEKSLSEIALRLNQEELEIADQRFKSLLASLREIAFILPA